MTSEDKKTLSEWATHLSNPTIKNKLDVHRILKEIYEQGYEDGLEELKIKAEAGLKAIDRHFE